MVIVELLQMIETIAKKSRSGNILNTTSYFVAIQIVRQKFEAIHFPYELGVSGIPPVHKLLYETWIRDSYRICLWNEGQRQAQNG